jgi:hypothetical protein
MDRLERLREDLESLGLSKDDVETAILSLLYNRPEDIMRAIEFQLGATKLLDIRYGESNFKVIDEFWIDFKPDSGEKTTAFVPCVCKDTEKNRIVVKQIQEIYQELKRITDEKEKQVITLRHQLEK